ncbi:MAG: dethiobiotin synthase, partial [Arenimonas sp.]|uniref:dethiobiotin synthase n=1 Tax=Arenimonas sp. TaxID=1872635 RepID=UPI0025C185D0
PGVGNTNAWGAVLPARGAGGASAVGFKRVARGCEATPEGLRNDDALALQAASDPRPAYALVNPYALPEPTAPQIAAERAGVQIHLGPMLEAYRSLQALSAQVVVEGVGGWLAPLADDLEQADLVRALDLPVILVVGLKLGCLNHARLTARAIQADGCRLHGWIGSNVEGLEPRYIQLVAQALPVPCLGVLPHAPGASPASLAAKLSVG